MKFILAFPSSFGFRVVLPLNFDKFDHPVSQLALRFVKDTQRVFNISKVRLKIQFVHGDGFGGNAKAFLQLRDVENIVHVGERQREIQFICDLPTSRDNFERTNIARSQFTPHLEPLSTPKWGYLEIDIISNFESESSPAAIGVA